MVGAVGVEGRQKEEGGKEGKGIEDRAQIRYLEKEDGKTDRGTNLFFCPCWVGNTG
jgi:hypothetical protein